MNELNIRIARLLSTVAAVLAACGCGGDDSRTLPADGSLPVRALAAPKTTISVEDLMNWAQREYPAYFPDNAQTGVWEGYQYRFYPSTGNYLGVFGNDVRVLGPITGGMLTQVGTMDDFKCRVAPAICATARGQKLIAGQSMSAAIADDGQLLMWGSTQNFRLAVGTALAGSNARTVATQVKQLAIATYGAVILDQAGLVYEYGSAEAGWMAAPGQATSIPRLIPRDQRVKQVLLSGRSGNYDQPFFLMEDGTLTTTGFGPGGYHLQKDIESLSYGSGIAHAIKTDGRVIRLENSSVYGVFAEVQGASNVKSVSCSGSHCLALKSDGTVLAWGEDISLLSQIADPIQRQRQALPVAGLADVVMVSAGDGRSYTTSAAITSDGRLYVWGQLASESLSVPRFQPTLIASVGKVTDVSCSSHCLVRKEDGSIWGWGYDRLAITGAGRSAESISSPAPLGGIVVTANAAAQSQ